MAEIKEITAEEAVPTSSVPTERAQTTTTTSTTTAPSATAPTPKPSRSRTKTSSGGANAEKKRKLGQDNSEAEDTNNIRELTDKAAFYQKAFEKADGDREKAEREKDEALDQFEKLNAELKRMTTKKEGQIMKLDSLLTQHETENDALKAAKTQLELNVYRLEREKSILESKLKEVEENEIDRKIAARENQFNQVLKYVYNNELKNLNFYFNLVNFLFRNEKPEFQTPRDPRASGSSSRQNESPDSFPQSSANKSWEKSPQLCRQWPDCSRGQNCRFVHLPPGNFQPKNLFKSNNFISRRDEEDFNRKVSVFPDQSPAKEVQHQQQPRGTFNLGQREARQVGLPRQASVICNNIARPNFVVDCSYLNSAINPMKLNKNELESLTLSSIVSPNYNLDPGTGKLTEKNPSSAKIVTNPGVVDNMTKVPSFSIPLSSSSKSQTSRKNTSYVKTSSMKKGLVHRNNHKKSFKKNLHKPNFNNLRIMSNNIRGLGSKKSSLEDILESQTIDICCIQEVNNRNPPKIKNYVQFNKFDKSKRRMHGVCILVHNSIRQHVMRIPDESDLECVHLRLNHTTPALNILGLYLDVESRTKIDDLDRVFGLLQYKVENILSHGESCIIIGDWNRPELFTDKDSYATKQLKEWLENEETDVKLLNDDTPTRQNPIGGMSVLDLAVVSNNIENCVQKFTVDSHKKWTPFAIRKKNGINTKHHSDHMSIMIDIKLPVIKKKNPKSKPIINFRKDGGWERYAIISNEYAHKIKELVDTIENASELERKIHMIDLEIQIEAFGITWIKSNSKKRKRRDSKELNEIAKEQSEELDLLLSEGYIGRDLNSKMYKMKTVINGPKNRKQEPMAINDPVTKELLVNEEEIKKASLLHNIKILTKNDPQEEDIDLIEEKKLRHKEIMEMNDKDEWELTYEIYDKVTKKIKEKNKKMYELYNKAGDDYKIATFEYMKKLIKSEEVPRIFLNTTLTQIWKGKGSALDLNNMRFIHMRFWRSRLLEALITENMKDDIVNACPNIQLGGMPGAMSVEHLVVLKTWMKQKEEQNDTGIFNVYDMSKFFDKESLVDCMNVLNKEAKVSHKSYRIWYKLNEGTKISVTTSVGETDQATIWDSIGQGSVGAALVSALNIGVAIKETFLDQYTANIGEVLLNTLIFQDDISKMNDNIEQAKEGCHKIDRTLKSKLLSANYDKSKYLIIGNEQFRKDTLEKIEEDPIEMGGIKILHSSQEKYLGDIIDERGCKESITATIKSRVSKLISKTEEIIQLASHPAMGGIGGANIAFKLYEAQIIPALLHNCESWISLDDSHIKLLQEFQEKFVRRLLWLHSKIPKVLLEYDTGLEPMKWRIAYRKLNFLRKIMAKPSENITKNIILEEVRNNINGLASECRKLCKTLNLPSLITKEVTKAELKNAVKNKIIEECLERMKSSKKVADRIELNPSERQYLQTLSIANSRVYFRYRARSLANVKMNAKKSWKENLTCRLCDTDAQESQEHLESCKGTEFERRSLRMESFMGKVTFWKRMTTKLEKMTKKATATSKRFIDLSAPCGGPINYSGCIHVNCVDCNK